ncbi:hypothetical protein DY000_02008139 [Brassica cretica]|uniref:Uncharacterized protein n=1 Tax=Brassica cretica TaxID=69181 RepID=A0ABQ7BXB0_BRACR|nr:hypothetical protein DY000_02008139 [Brassica cretica]
MFRRNSVGNGRRNSDDFKFLDFVRNWSLLELGEEEILVQVSFGTAITERSSATVYELADGNEEDVVGTKKSS